MTETVRPERFEPEIRRLAAHRLSDQPAVAGGDPQPIRRARGEDNRVRRGPPLGGL